MPSIGSWIISFLQFGGPLCLTHCPTACCSCRAGAAEVETNSIVWGDGALQPASINILLGETSRLYHGLALSTAACAGLYSVGHAASF